MKICIVTSSYPLGESDAFATAGLFVRSFAEAVAELGVDVKVLTQDRDAKPASTEGSVRLVTYPWFGRGKRASYLRPGHPVDAMKMVSLVRQGWRALKRLHQEEQFDHVMAMWAAPGGHLARRLRWNHGVPYSVWCLGSDIWNFGRKRFFREEIGRVLNDAELAYADGYALAAEAELIGGRSVSFLPSSRKLETAAREHPSVGAHVHDESPRFCFVGRYADVKGVDVLLESFAEYRSQGGTGTLYMHGGGPCEGQIRERAASPDLDGHVHVFGFAEEAKVVAWMQFCDAVVIPSRMESIPVVLSDALQVGKPTIVTDVGDMGGLVRRHEAGLTVPPEDPKALASALLKVSTSAAGRWDRGVAALAQQFDVSNSAERWLTEISELASETVVQGKL